jgi:hypothetical protein
LRTLRTCDTFNSLYALSSLSSLKLYFGKESPPLVRQSSIDLNRNKLIRIVSL